MVVDQLLKQISTSLSLVNNIVEYKESNGFFSWLRDESGHNMLDHVDGNPFIMYNFTNVWEMLLPRINSHLEKLCLVPLGSAGQTTAGCGHPSNKPDVPSSEITVGINKLISNFLPKEILHWSNTPEAPCVIKAAIISCNYQRQKNMKNR